MEGEKIVEPAGQDQGAGRTLGGQGADGSQY